MRKPTAFLLALIIAFSAMAVTAAADGREPFTGREADCRIDFAAASVTVGETVEMMAVGSSIDLFESDTVPVEGDTRLIPVKWTAKRADNDKVIDSGEWTNSRTAESDRIETADVELERGTDPVAIVVEVVFAKQEYKDGEWETTGEYTKTATFESEPLPMALQMIWADLIFPITLYKYFFDVYYDTLIRDLFSPIGFSPRAVSGAINLIIRKLNPAKSYSFEQIIIAIIELFS